MTGLLLFYFYLDLDHFILIFRIFILKIVGVGADDVLYCVMFFQ